MSNNEDQPVSAVGNADVTHAVSTRAICQVGFSDMLEPAVLGLDGTQLSGQRRGDLTVDKEGLITATTVVPAPGGKMLVQATWIPDEVK